MTIWRAAAVMFTCIVCGFSLMTLGGCPLALTPHAACGGTSPTRAEEYWDRLDGVFRIRAALVEVDRQVGFDQKLGAKLPLAARFRDESGRELPLGDSSAGGR